MSQSIQINFLDEIKEYFEYKKCWAWDMNTDLFEYKLFLSTRDKR